MAVNDKPLRDPFQVLDHGYVKLITRWGGDENIIEAARMSTGKGFNRWGPPPCAPECASWAALAGAADKMFAICTCGNSEKQGDEKLLHFLYTKRHHTPFEMVGMQIEVQAPILVFREWHRHRTQSYNEFSARYSEMPDLRYVPSVERMLASAQSQVNKQGSGEPLDPDVAMMAREVIRATGEKSFYAYRCLLEQGVAKEVARCVLPVNQYSKMRAQATLRNWLGFMTLRTAQDAQWEIRQYADRVAQMVECLFPRTYALWKAEQ